MSDSFDHVDYFEYVQQLLGNEIRESNGPMIQTLSAEDLANVREAYHQGFYAFNSFLSNNSDQGLDRLKGAPTPYKREAPRLGEFRPILHGQLHASTYIFGGDASRPWESPEHSERLAGLKRLLLYSHRVILPDPLWYVNAYFSGKEEGWFTSKSRAALTNFLDFLFMIRGLVQAGIVSFYPQYEHASSPVGYPKDAFIDDQFCTWLRSQTDD